MILQLRFVYNQNTDSHGIYVAMQLHSADACVRACVCVSVRARFAKKLRPTRSPSEFGTGKN
jgi:hypothetical protein